MIKEIEELKEINELKGRLNRLMGDRFKVDDEILELSEKIDRLIIAYYKKKFSKRKVI